MTPSKLSPEYKRTVVFRTEDVEIIIIEWEPGSQTPIHDHRKSHGLVKILSGNLVENVFSLPNLEQMDSMRYQCGAVRFVTPGFIHSIKNVDQTSAKSLHIYTPRLVMTEYTKIGNRIYKKIVMK